MLLRVLKHQSISQIRVLMQQEEARAQGENQQVSHMQALLQEAQKQLALQQASIRELSVLRDVTPRVNRNGGACGGMEDSPSSFIYSLEGSTSSPTKKLGGMTLGDLNGEDAVDTKEIQSVQEAAARCQIQT